MAISKFRGTGTALVTPFKEDLSIDFDALERLVEHCISGGVDYLVVMGTTGENPTLNEEEQYEVLRHVQTINAGRKPVVFGIGGNNTAAILAKISQTNFEGIDAILSVSPYYNKPTQTALYHHYKSLAEASPVPIILYNVPGRTGSNMTSDTTLQLAHDFDKIVGVKEASGNLEQVMEIIDSRPEGFLVISGDDNLSLPIIASGGDGVISVSGQGFPKIFTEMVNAALEGRMAEARENHYRLFEITKMLFAEGNPGGIKAALKTMGICEEYMRQPLWPISEHLREAIHAEIKHQAL
jgi:4-hydroxy-tetrahydrodipicolinate synthase